MQTYTYRESMKKDVAATLDTIKSLGITDLECGVFRGKTLEESRKMLDERGMRCTSFGGSYDDLINKTAEVGRKAKAMGAEYVMLAWIRKGPEFTLADAQAAVTNFNRFGKQLKEEFGLTFCYHNHGYEFVKHEDGTLMDYLIKNTDPRYVSFELDLLWAKFPGADPAALLTKYGNRFKLIHLKDLRKGVVGDLSGGTPTTNDVALGSGQMDMPAILKAAKKAGVQHYYIEDESPIYFQQVPQSMAYLKSLKE
ncbi:MAG: sugar phosphate isomerase/epimerase [Sphingobacteriaceae bacterium]|nr:sugar phosphate isomerase/epimerase [Cytophagaceae bacterium]